MRCLREKCKSIGWMMSLFCIQEFTPVPTTVAKTCAGQRPHRYSISFEEGAPGTL